MITRALLFTDLVDSTRLVERLGDARAAEVFAAHDRARAPCSPAIAAARSTAPTASSCCSTTRRTPPLRARLPRGARGSRAQRPGGHPCRPRHAARERARGHCPRRQAASRSRASPSRLPPASWRSPAAARRCMSAAARDALADAHSRRTRRSSGTATIVSRGSRSRSRSSSWGCATIASFSPPADADKAYRVVRAGDFWRPVREVRHNLPAERDAFVGRTAELRALAARLDAGRGCVTVLGPGGTGKTRLVRRYGWTWLGDWPGGVYFCDLSSAPSLDGHLLRGRRPRSMCRSARTIPACSSATPSPAAGAAWSSSTTSSRSCEHAPATVGRWLDRAAEASFVVTSRERLHLPGEEVFPIEPLPLEMDAIDLFVARARAQQPDFVLERRQPRRGRRGRAPARRSAARHRAGGGAGARALAGATGRTDARPLPAACRRPRRRGAPGHAAGRDRLVVGPARAVGAGRVRPVLGVRGRLHARGGRGGARPLALARSAIDDGRGPGARRQEPAAHPGCPPNKAATTSRNRTSGCTSASTSTRRRSSRRAGPGRSGPSRSGTAHYFATLRHRRCDRGALPARRRQASAACWRSSSTTSSPPAAAR